MKNIVTFLLQAVALVIVPCALAYAQDEAYTSLFQPNWESLRRYECPEWFRDAKFGIYAHWGPYAVPAYRSEWYSDYM